MSQEHTPQWIVDLVENNKPDSDKRVYVSADDVFVAVTQTLHHMFHTSIKIPIEKDTTPEEAYQRFCDIVTDKFNKDELDTTGESHAIAHTEVLGTKANH